MLNVTSNEPGPREGELMSAFRARCAKIRREIDVNLKHWHTAKKTGDPNAQIDLLCSYCGAKHVGYANYYQLKREWEQGHVKPPHNCLVRAEIKREAEKYLHPSWTVTSPGSTDAMRNTIWCSCGHKRRVSLKQIKREAMRSDGHQLECGKCLRYHGAMLER